MESNEHISDPKIGRFWLKYSQLLRSFRVSEKAIPWYRRHIEHFMVDHPNVKLRMHTAQSVELWLIGISRNPNITEWQFRQKIDAVRILVGHLLRLPWSQSFDWDRWLSGTQALESDGQSVP